MVKFTDSFTVLSFMNAMKAVTHCILRIFGDIIKVIKMRSCGNRLGPKPNDEREKTQRHGGEGREKPK